MARIASLLLVLFLTGCTTVALEIGVGYDTHLDQGSNPRNITSLRGEMEGCFNTKGTCIAHYTHQSSYFSGWPFNDRPENVSNHWGGIYRYPLWESR
jgi:hypothetical protein